jgi:hypothetical protein
LNKVKASELDFFSVGNSLHLEGSIWTDKNNGKVYLLKIDDEEVIDLSNAALLDFNDTEKLHFLKQADVVECRLYEGPERNMVKTIIKKSQVQVEPNIVWRVFARDNFTCVYCKRNNLALTFDHFIPKSLGGTTTVENGRTSCRRCNKLKNDLAPEEWFASKQYKRVSGEKCQTH